MSDEPGVAGGQPLVSRLRAVIEAKDEQIAGLVAGLDAARERERKAGAADRGTGTPAGDGQL